MQLTGNRQPGREAGPDWLSTGYPMTIRALCGVARVLAILLDSSFFCEKACVRTLQGVSCSAPIRVPRPVTFRSGHSLPSSATSAEKVYSTSTDCLPSPRAAADGYSRKRPCWVQGRPHETAADSMGDASSAEAMDGPDSAALGRRGVVQRCWATGRAETRGS